MGERDRSRVGNLGMALDTRWVFNSTGMSMGMIFYLWVTPVLDLNRDGYGTSIFSHSRIIRRIPDSLLSL
jgi:hypothetical protein